MHLLFSDIHANRHAADQIARIANNYDRLVFAGDLCGYGTDWAYVIDLFIELGVDAVRGNHDQLVLDDTMSLADYPPRVSEPILQTRRELTSRHRDYLDALPTELNIDDTLYVRHTVGFDAYCHEPADCLPLLSQTDAPVIVIGHTHIQRCFHIDGRTVVNPGSISHGRTGHHAGYATHDNGQITLHNMEAAP